jgi:hypothetical protein
MVPLIDQYAVDLLKSMVSRRRDMSTFGDLIEQGAGCNSEKQSSFEGKADED